MNLTTHPSNNETSSALEIKKHARLHTGENLARTMGEGKSIQLTQQRKADTIENFLPAGKIDIASIEKKIMEKYPATPEHPLSKEELTASIVGMEDNYYIPDARTFASAA